MYSILYPNIMHYLILALFLFIIGLVGVVISKNLVRVLISLEIMMSAINLNFISFAVYRDTELSGLIFALFVTVVSALQVAVALSLFIIKFRNKNNNVSSKELEELRE